MKKILFTYFFFLSFTCFSQHVLRPYSVSSWAANPGDTVHYSNFFDDPYFKLVVFPDSRAFGEIKQFEKLELGIQLNDELTEAVNLFLRKATKKPQINPFDPEQISVEAVFTSEKGNKKTAYGFYYNEYQRDMETQTWREDTTSFHWRIRFAPEETGLYSCRVIIKVPGKELASKLFYFQCTESSNKGFIETKEKGTLNGRYLTFSKTGETFFALGINMDWPAYVDANSPAAFHDYYHKKNKIPLSTQWGKLQSHQYQYYNLWMKKLKESGGNFFALAFVLWGHYVEWDKLNDYSTRLPEAWEVDYIVNRARELDLYLSVLFSTNQMYRKDEQWHKNPYNSSNQSLIPGIIEPLDFFSNGEARKYYKKLLRYIVARWGYSKNIVLWEIISEIDAILQDHNYSGNAETRKIFKSWYDEMFTYMRNELGDPHLISGSYATQETKYATEKIFTTADVSMIHRYGRDPHYNYYTRYGDAEKLLNHKQTFNKPVVLDEMGLGGPCPDYCSDLGFHTNIWATSFMGTFGCGWNWWWDNAIFINGYEKNFTALANFIRGEELAKENYSAYRYKNAGSFKRAELESYYLVNGTQSKVIGWLHNTSYQWYNIQNNSCIDSMIANNNGKHIDPPDNTAYAKEAKKNNADGHFTDYTGLEIKVKGLKKRENYSVEWFFTTGNGGSTGNTDFVKTNGRGIATIKVPEKLSEYGDAAFKILQLPPVDKFPFGS